MVWILCSCLAMKSEDERWHTKQYWTYPFCMLPVRWVCSVWNVVSLVWRNGVVLVRQRQSQFHVFLSVLVRSLLQVPVLVFLTLQLPPQLLLRCLNTKWTESHIHRFPCIVAQPNTGFLSNVIQKMSFTCFSEKSYRYPKLFFVIMNQM